MKIIVIPDLHLDRKFKVTYGDASRFEELPYKLLQEILCKEGKQALYVFLGDVFDNSRPSYRSFFKFQRIMSNFDVKIISGNHDLPTVFKEIVLEYLPFHIIKRNTTEKIDVSGNFWGIAWHDTQEMFERDFYCVLEKPNLKTMFLHAGYNKWENKMDNVITDEMITAAKTKNIKLISGHEHTHNIHKNTLFHLGSIIPYAMSEHGPKYYWSSIEGLKEIPHGVGSSEESPFILTNKEIPAQGDKPIIIRKTTVKKEDLVLEKKELDLDMIEAIKTAALKKNFTKTFLKEVL